MMDGSSRKIDQIGFESNTFLKSFWMFGLNRPVFSILMTL
jgi:hypothetical protein